MKRSFLLLLLIAAASFLRAQDFSNKGKDFWLGYGYHSRFVTNGGCGTNTNCQDMVLYFATENIPNKFTDIKIEIPAVGYSQTISNVAPGTIVTSNPIPKSGSQDARLTNEGLFTTGIHVTSTRPVVAYTHIYSGNVSGATLLFPTSTLGKEYYSMNYTQLSNESASNSFFFVVATDTGTTTVEIVPSAQTQTHAAGVPFTVTLNQGEIYNVMGELNGGSPGNYSGADLTGSRIRSISNGEISCKKIGVFSGSGKIKISCSGSATSSDNLIAQAFPKNAWGKKFLTVPTENMPYNYYRVGVGDPATVVKLNGVVLTGLQNNFYYDLPLSNQPQVIEADEPIMVAQYITTANTCGNNAIGANGDPEMIYLSPVEQTIDEVVLNSTPNASISQHWVNVIIKSAATASFSITGALGGVTFFTHPEDPTYSYAQINVSAGSHTLKADSGFNAIAYGYGNAESYGYNAGTNLKDLYNFVEPLNPLNISETNAACACTPFYYTVTYPFQPLSLFWDFKGYQTPNVNISNPVADSTYFINGKQVWRYKLPTPYSYCPSGNYPVSITAGIAGSDGCGNTQVKDDTLFVRDTPLPDFTWVHNGCLSDSVRFTDATVYDEGIYSYKWFWDFGDGTTSTNLQNPAHKYNAPGTYTISYYMVTNIGCVSEPKTAQITISDVPVANFAVSDTLCFNKSIHFTDSSVVSPPGTIAAWYWNFGDGIKDTTLSNENVVHVYNTVGPATATLQIEMVGGCLSNVFSKAFVVHPNPFVDFNLPVKVCLPYDVASFTDASSISDGSEDSFKWTWDFGDPASGINNSATVNNPTHLYSTAGPFTVKLVVTSGEGCADSTSKLFSAIFPKTPADFTLSPENCLHNASDFFSATNALGGNISNWYWTFGDATNGNGQSASHTYAAPGSYSISHWVAIDNGCNSDTVTKNILVNPLPVANFTPGTAACKGTGTLFTDQSIPGAGNIVSWTWNFGDGKPDSLISNGQPFLYRFDSVKTYQVSLSVLTDKGCVSATPYTLSVQVNPTPEAGFISPEVCLTDASAQFTDTSSVAGGSISSWNWNFGDPGSGINNIFNGVNAQHTYNSTGFYTVTLRVTSNSGCIDSIAQAFTVNGDIPKANFIVPASINFCSNDSVRISDSSSVNFGNVTKVEIYWDVLNNPSLVETDDFPAFGKNYVHHYPEFQSPLSKDFFIKYKSYSGASCVDSVTKKVVVHAAPSVLFSSVAALCPELNTYQVTEAAETGGVPGLGVFSGSNISGTGIFSPSAAGAGNYPVLYTYTSTFGCVDTLSGLVTVLQPAIARFGFSSPACERAGIIFTDSSVVPAGSGTISNWSWSYGDGTPLVSNGTGIAVNHTYNNATNYSPQLTITTSNGCTSSVQQQLQVNPLPLPGFTLPGSVCLPAALVNFTDASTIADGTQNSFTYSWNFGDAGSGNNNSVSKNPSHTYGAAGPYTIRLVVTSGAGCKDSIAQVFSSIHPQPSAGINADSASICENQTVLFSDNSTGADGVLTQWLWDFDNGNTSAIQNPASQTYNTAGQYSIELQVENSFGCRDTLSRLFTVYAAPVISAGPDRVLLEGGQITIEATATGTGLQYAWVADQPGNYLSSATVLQPVVSGISSDITYQLTVVGAGGCWRQDEVLIQLLKAPVIPNTFSPNGDGINEHWTIQYLDSYPDCKVKVFNRDGQAVFESHGYSGLGWDGRYKGKPLPFGTYYYIIEPGSGRQPMSGYVTIVY